MGVNIQAKFKKDSRDLNGLEEVAEDMLGEPLKRLIVVAEVEVVRSITDYKDGGTQTPVVNFVHIEPLDGDAAATARQLLDGSYRARSGKVREATLFDGDPDAPADGPVSERPKDVWLTDNGTAEG